MNKVLKLALILAGIATIGTYTVKAESIYANKDSASHYMTLGKKEQEARKYSNAWRYYEQAARFDGRDADAQIAIADVCLKMNKMAPAVKALETATQIRPNDYETQWKLAKMYFNFSQHDKVISMVPTLHSKVADAKGWAFMLGKSYHAQQLYGKAIEHLQIALKDEPSNAEAAYLVGRMYVQMSNYKAAIPYYERTFAIDSTSQPARTYEFAMVLATAGQYDAAVRTFEKALSRGYKPRDDFYMNMAFAMADAHKSDEAIKMLRELLSRRPGDLGLLNGLADVCYHGGRYKEAIGYWDTVLGMDDKNAQVLYRIGTAYIKMGKDKDGQLLCDRAIEMEPALGVLKHAKQMQF